MIKKERLIGALVMGLLWVAVAAAPFFIHSSPSDKLGVFLLILFISLLCLVLGLIAYLGDVRVIAGFNMMTEKERSHYNINRVTFFIGILCVAMSYAFFLIYLSGILFTIVIVALTAVTIVFAFYVGVGKRFRADA